MFFQRNSLHWRHFFRFFDLYQFFRIFVKYRSINTIFHHCMTNWYFRKTSLQHQEILRIQRMFFQRNSLPRWHSLFFLLFLNSGFCCCTHSITWRSSNQLIWFINQIRILSFLGHTVTHSRKRNTSLQHSKVFHKLRMLTAFYHYATTSRRNRFCSVQRMLYNRYTFTWKIQQIIWLMKKLCIHTILDHTLLNGFFRNISFQHQKILSELRMLASLHFYWTTRYGSL